MTDTAPSPDETTSALGQQSSAPNTRELQFPLANVPGPNEPSLDEAEKTAQSSLQAASSAGGTGGGAMPTSFFWTDKNGYDYVSGVGNQPDVGACYAFATLAAIESNFRIDLESPELSIDRSEKFVHFCLLQKDKNEGENATEILEATKSLGILLEECMLFRPDGRLPNDQGNLWLVGCDSLCENWEKKAVVFLTTIPS